MNADNDWVEDVKRWCRADHRSGIAGLSAADADDDSQPIGYEAAHPSLQARHWPEAQGGLVDSPV